MVFDRKVWEKEYRIKNREKINQMQKDAYYSSKSSRANHLLKSAKKRAGDFGVKFNLDKDWILKKLEKGICEITKIPFSFFPPKTGYKAHPYAPSLERIKPKGGYTRDNVKVVIWAVNICKWEWTVKDFKKIIRAIYKGFKNYE